MARIAAHPPPQFFLYGETAPDAALDALHVEPIRERSSRHGWVIDPHRHPRHAQFLLFTRGAAEIRIEGDILAPAAGALVVHPVGAVHAIRYRHGTEGLTITVAGDYLDALLRDEPELAALVRTPAAYPLGALRQEVARAFGSILDEHRRHAPGWRVAERGHFLTILAALLRLSSGRDAPAAGRRDRELAERLRGLVETSFRSEKRMGFYAGALGVSPQRLNAACKSALGRTASQILHDRLMVEARRNLAYTGMTVAEIGHDLGFDDPAYFNRFFTARAGQPPGAWRAEFTATQPVPAGGSVE